MAQFNPANLTRMFVTEIGIRQTWYFINFCENLNVKSEEHRLYIDTDFTIYHNDARIEVSDYAIRNLDVLSNLIVMEAEISSTQELSICFENDYVLTVSGTSNEDTVHDVWWFSS